MHSLVIYDSKFGNTERIAAAIGRGLAALGDVRVVSTGEAAGEPRTAAELPDLLVVGGPTHNRGPSNGLRAFLDALPDRFRGIPCASFDTRYRGPALLMGSAAAGADKVLRRAGGSAVAPPESFYIVRRGPLELQVLEPGELDRAEQWGRSLAAAAGQGEGTP